jgi:hypothetical protein
MNYAQAYTQAKQAIADYRFASCCQNYREGCGLRGRLFSSRINTVDPLYAACVAVSRAGRLLNGGYPENSQQNLELGALRKEVSTLIVRDFLNKNKKSETGRFSWMRFLFNTQESPSFAVAPETFWGEVNKFDASQVTDSSKKVEEEQRKLLRWNVMYKQELEMGVNLSIAATTTVLFCILYRKINS